MQKKSSANDFNLIRGCINNQPDAWNTFVRRFSKLVYHSIMKTLESYSAVYQQEEVEDIYNDVFLSLIKNDFKKLRQFKGKDGASLATWIRLIAARHTIDFLRSQKQQISINDETEFTRPMAETLHDRKPSAHDQMETSEMQQMLAESIRQLSPSDRVFTRLYFEKEMSPEEIARTMNVSVNAIYIKKNRIQTKLLTIMKNRRLRESNPD